MEKYGVSSPYYIIFKDDEIVDSSIDEEISHTYVDDKHTITFSNKQVKQVHIVFDISSHSTMNVEYILEPKALIDLIETRVLGDGSTLNRAFDVKEDCTLKLYNENISENQEKVTFDDHIKVSNDSKIHVGYGELSDGSLDATYNYELVGEGADVKLRLGGLSKHKDKKTYTVEITHKAPYTFGRMDNYGVVMDEGHLFIDGIGRIDEGMHGSESHQTNNIIVFDEKCYARANPYLYIDNYDVKASHAAAVGKLDEDDLFYLQSRGLTKNEALRLITYGYLRPVSDVIDNDALKERFDEMLSKKVGDSE